MSNPNDVLSLADVAAILGRSIASVRHYIRHAGLPHAMPAGRYVILRGNLQEWVDRPETREMMLRGDVMLRKTAREPGVNQLDVETSVSIRLRGTA
ncbi:MAG: helix-turn-helix domain-containing protein [Paludisphaera borealis]|uniref:helix-turn-helix domain-containing protein n=1 Tax=Paludisphaera borealis TaxID=1387353 RepID=UPI00284FBC36|nr:helix-turn-helix domain-containing protein [Paludisphaera borealis]MDR3621561.1 helix-turn-helix domain-containing protein [Paludisphaera borealis]